MRRSGETVTTPENARPVTKGTSEKDVRSEDETEVMLMKLGDFIKYGEVIPPMALTQEQKDGIILVLREWKDVLDSGKQNAYEPVPEEKEESSLSDTLDMMIRLLSGKEAGGHQEGGPPSPPSEG